ncbi:MAG: hypothetical protein AAFV53_04400 [Myxococcota bacterium]
MILHTHLDNRGFSQTSPGCWSRGNPIGAWLAMTPRSWPVQIDVDGRDVKMRVRAGGQILTRAEEAFWEEEWTLLRRAAAGQPCSARRVQQQRDVALVENSVITGVSVAIGGAAGLTAATAFALPAAAGAAIAMLGSLTSFGLGVWWLRLRPEPFNGEPTEGSLDEWN